MWLETSFGGCQEEFVLDADVTKTCDSTSDNLIDSTCVEQNVGTDISADLEKEAHRYAEEGHAKGKVVITL